MSVVGERKQGPIDPSVRKLLVGDPVYVDDVRAKERVAYFGLVRSPHASARIRKIDFSKTIENEELTDFISGADLSQERVDAFPIEVADSGKYPITYGYLASEKASYVGQPIAAVLASNMYSVEDLVDQVAVEYDVSEPICTVEMSRAATTTVHDALKDNMTFSTRFIGGSLSRAQEGGIDTNKEKRPDAKDRTLHRIKARFKVNRQAAVPIEARTIISSYDRKTESFTVHATVQQPEVLQDILSRALKVPADKITVRKSSLGGAFGAKGAVPYPEAVLGCILARRNPDLAIKWVSSRTEDLLESVQGRDKSCEIELVCDDGAKIRELKARIEADVGAFEVPANGNFSVLNTARLLPGVYRIPSIDIEATCYVTNKPPSGPIRDMGKAEACFFIERAIDVMAGHLKMDPVEFRRRNLIKPEEFPYDNGTGFVYDSGNLFSLLEDLLKESDYESLKAWREKINSAFLHRIDDDSTSGKKNPEVSGDRKLAGIGISLAIEDNTVSTRPNARDAKEVPKRVKTFPSGAHLCALLVDAETGTVEIKKYVVVDDYGPALNLGFADGRIHGGLGREIGAALFEEILYDDRGQPLNPSFLDYLVPTAQTVPNVSTVHRETPSPLIENGSKGLGEIGTIGVMAAVANAISDAISYASDGTIDFVPARPEAVRKILQESMS